MKASIKKSVIFIAVFILFACMIPALASPVHAAAKPARVKIKAPKVVYMKNVKVSWKKTKNAKKYEVLVYDTKTKKWYKNKDKITKTTFTFAGKYNRTYKIKVRALNGKKKGPFSKVKTIKTLKKPKNLKKFYDKSPEFRKDIEDETVAINKNLESLGMSIQVSVTGNAVLYRFSIPAITASELDPVLLEELTTTLAGIQTKDEAHLIELIKADQKLTGLTDIIYKFEYVDSQSVVLLTQSFNDQGLI